MADAVAEGEDDDQLLLTMPLFEEQIAALRRRVAMHPVHGAARSEMSSCVGIFVVWRVKDIALVPALAQQSCASYCPLGQCMPLAQPRPVCTPSVPSTDAAFLPPHPPRRPPCDQTGW